MLPGAGKHCDGWPLKLSPGKSRQIRGFSFGEIAIKKSLKIPEGEQGIKTLIRTDLLEATTAESRAWATFSIGSVALEAD